MNFQYKFWALIILTLIGCSSCKDDPQKNESNLPGSIPDIFADTSSYPRVYEYRNGSIELNDIAISPRVLEKKIAEIQTRGTIVLYSSEIPSAHPPRESAVAELFKKYRVPVKTFTDKTFTKSYY